MRSVVGMARRNLSAICVALMAVLFLSSSALCAEDWDSDESTSAPTSKSHAKAVAEESEDTEQWEDAEETESSAKTVKSKSKSTEDAEAESTSAKSSQDGESTAESKDEKKSAKAQREREEEDASIEEVVKDPKKRKKEKIDFDLKTATNLDEIEADEGNLRTFSQKVSDEPKKSFEELQQDRQKSLFESGMKGAVKGAGWGLYGVVAVLVLFGIGKLVLRKTGAEQSASRGRGAAAPSNSKNELYLVAGGAVLSMLIGISAGAVPMMMESMDTHKKVFEKTIKEKPPIRFEQVYSKLFALQALMPEGFRKIKIEFPEAPLAVVSTKGYDTSRHSTPDPLPLEYWSCVYEDKRNGMALGYSKLPPIPNDKSDAESGWITVFDTNLALDAAVKGACESVNGKSTFVIPIGLDEKHPGREIEGHLDEGLKDSGIFRERIFATQLGNYCSVVVWGEPKFVNSNQAYKFLDSLSIPGSEKEEKSTVSKDSNKRLTEEDETRFLQKAANAIQTNLDLTDAYPTNLDGTLRVTKMVVGIDPEGKVTKMDLKTVFEESDHEKLAKALTKAVTNSSPFTDVPEFPGQQFLFRLKLVGDKIQVLSRTRKSAPIEAQIDDDESLTSDEKSDSSAKKPSSSSSDE